MGSDTHLITPPADLPATLGALRESGCVSRPVKEEVRENAVASISAGMPLFEGVLGYEETVMPQLENALLAGHDVIFLGERGQAKTRMIRSLVGLLDEWMPIVVGSEINDDPYAPVSRHARISLAEHGDEIRSHGCTAASGMARSWQPQTRRSLTSSVKLTRSRWLKVVTSLMSSRCITAWFPARTAGFCNERASRSCRAHSSWFAERA